MTSDKAGAALLAQIFVQKGLRNIIISPGSRNAPLVISFAQNPSINALSIVDERSAAYFALGMAQQSKKTVAITCTSGGATLNYAPAIAEAYYQKIPLLVITSDRPDEQVDNGDGQTIRQKNVYANFIKGSYEIPGEIESDHDFLKTAEVIDEAINLTMAPDCGPVHINIPFTEPIYQQVDSFNFQFNTTSPDYNLPGLSTDQILKFSDKWNSYSKKLLIAGMMDPNPRLLGLLKQITNDPSVVLLSETTSNLVNGCSCSCIDKVVHTISEDESEMFKPELLVTFGGHVVSKMVKAFLRKNKAIEHWHIHETDFRMNTYQCLTDGLEMKPETFFETILPKIRTIESDYRSLWESRYERSEKRHTEFMQDCIYSDLKVFEILLKQIPENSNLQMGNSTPVRYVQLFKPTKKHIYYSNRGTSGIDGAVSTASGAAWINNQPLTLITGDLGFLYDSNALMNHHLKSNLRIIVINNNGGGIFRFIPGPGETQQLEEFFEANHSWNAEHIAKNYNVPYYTASNENELISRLPEFYELQNNDRPAILEIFTPNEKNGIVLKSYFKYLQE